MTLSDLAFWMSELSSGFIKIDGRIFVDRNGVGKSTLEAKIKNYASVHEAQYWMNIIPVADFIAACVGGEWDAVDSDALAVAQVFATVLQERAQLAFPQDRIRVEVWTDKEAGDLGVRLLQVEAD